MESDEDFSPKCDICKDRYGKIDLFPENRLVTETYNMLNHEFVINTGIENKVFEYFEDEVEDKKLFFIKLMKIFDTYKEASQEDSKPVKRKELRRRK